MAKKKCWENKQCSWWLPDWNWRSGEGWMKVGEKVKGEDEMWALHSGWGMLKSLFPGGQGTWQTEQDWAISSFCGSLSEAAGSWGAVQRHNSSQGKPSKRDGEREEKLKEPCRPNISPLWSRQNLSTRLFFISQLHDFQISCIVWNCYSSLLMWFDCPKKSVQCNFHTSQITD